MKKNEKKKASWMEKTPPQVNSTMYFSNPIVFFENLSIGNRKLTKQQLNEYQERMKSGIVNFFGGDWSGVRTVIGWNEEKSGWFYFREPLQKETVFDGFIGWDGKLQNMNEPQYCNGDGVSTWCIPPKFVLDVWKIK